ncbi:GIY-YIG nuclease family protein [Virgibacillus halodenitrificans]|uniref:GIY-YIG nuclease family protein n=1 Tax=Virgibacillus halodenitrificans TaxID=1482 RepID=A0ABR7VK87_VIRHA|nr:GIY-YIG nuclease family protein [Virgibacillus halodenitrificans]MBD1222131.1 GIY-YIG nuclease family protein [Virgibacillus halodenitrificans]
MGKYRDKWWYSSPVILIIAAFSFYTIPAIIAIILLIVQVKKRRNFYKALSEDELHNLPIREKEDKLESLQLKIQKLEFQMEKNKKVLADQDSFIAELRNEFESKTAVERENILKEAEQEAERIVKEANESLAEVVAKTTEYQSNMENLEEEHTQLEKEVNRYKNQARKFKADVVGLKNFNDRFPHTINFDDVDHQLEKLNKELDEETLLGTIIRLHLHSDHSKELRKLSNATKKEIKNVLNKYEDRYTTKGNKTIYNLMVIGLQAEVQILLLQLKYNKLDESEQSVKDIITKYLAICANGNKSILPTITKFLTEMEPLYLELIQIEYKYYVYREQEKEEQRMIKEQMRQEAEERKKLADEKKKLDKEEQKFIVEMERNKRLLEEEKDEDKIQQLHERLKELELQVKEIDVKKEEIASLTLGKAGYVYIISNLGSFGETMFKIGMTRRMEPQDRVDELGSASVPFKFDVHALVFSDDAVGLENKLHKMLSEQRVNKVNYRKEFFKTDVNTLKEMVEEIDPTVEFVTTMLAEEYNQTKAMEESALVS